MELKINLDGTVTVLVKNCAVTGQELAWKWDETDTYVKWKIYETGQSLECNSNGSDGSSNLNGYERNSQGFTIDDGCNSDESKKNL